MMAFLVKVQPRTFPLMTVAVAVAVPLEKMMLGAEVYPEPLLVRRMALTTPLLMVTVPAAPVPPPPEKVMVGAMEYPEPPLVMVMPEVKELNGTVPSPLGPWAP